jgi:hypothetical protein
MRTTILPATVALTLSTFLLFPKASRSAEEDTPAVAAARARQEAVKTLYVEFKLTEVMAKGAVSDARPEIYGKKAPVPAEDMTIESINRLVIDGEKARLEDNHPAWRNWHAPNGGLQNIRRITVFDAGSRTVLFPVGIFGSDGPHALIERNARFPFFSSEDLTPILMTFRGLHSSFNRYPVNLLTPVESTIPIDWTPCQGYKFKEPRSTSASLIWLDSEHDYIVRRMHTLSSEHLTIHYCRHDDWGWVPDYWISTGGPLQFGGMRGTIKVKVQNIRINAPLPGELLDMRFPPGCKVIDSTTEPRKEYQVQSDGSMREISEFTGKPLPMPQAQPTGPWYWRYRWLFGSLGVVLISLLLQYVLRRKQANSA